MTDTMVLHGIDQAWREATAAALEAKALSVSDMLAHIDNVVSMAGEDDPDGVAELRQVAGRWRTRRNDYVREAEQLRSTTP